MFSLDEYECIIPLGKKICVFLDLLSKLLHIISCIHRYLIWRNKKAKSYTMHLMSLLTYLLFIQPLHNGLKFFLKVVLYTILVWMFHRHIYLVLKPQMNRNLDTPPDIISTHWILPHFYGQKKRFGLVQKSPQHKTRNFSTKCLNFYLAGPKSTLFRNLCTNLYLT